jgi:hypothetical protein
LDGSIAGIHDRVVEHGREFEGGCKGRVAERATASLGGCSGSIPSAGGFVAASRVEFPGAPNCAGKSRGDGSSNQGSTSNLHGESPE